VRVYYVYMLRCFDGTFYTGVTNDIARRFAEHCDGYSPTGYTHTRRPVLLVYAGEFPRPDEAIAFEKQLKRWSHKKKRAFADHDWPLLKRLAIGPQLSPRAQSRGRLDRDDCGGGGALAKRAGLDEAC
jgi:putative endonuclease